MIAVLLPAFVACLILTGIHTYLGIHVLKRGVVFLDIALAQVAALGMTVALIEHAEPGSWTSYFMALAFTGLAALLFTFMKRDSKYQEAIIGVSFVVSSAFAILIADRLPYGGEHVQHILSGDVLWVTWPQIVKMTAIYTLIALIHLIWRRPLIAISFQEGATRPWGWDLLFYLTFGVVITSSVEIGGILLVFSYLIIPALASSYFATRLGGRIIFGWAFGFVGSACGILLSYFVDLPTGPSIVAVFGALLVLAVLLGKLTNASQFD